MLREVLKKSARDVVICGAYRTPITKANKGGLATTAPEVLLQQVIGGTVERAGVSKEAVDDVLVGAVLQTLGGHKVSALAVKSLGFPEHTTINTVNRQCASSAQAMSYVANALRSGELDVGIAAGVESMSFDYFPHRGIPTRVDDALLARASQDARDVLMPMGLTSERVAERFGVSRAAQDEFAFHSHRRAANATANGHFAREIVPVTSSEGHVVETDDGIRANISREKLAQLKPVFREDGTTTAGNSSQISDGAAAMVLTTRQRAHELGLTPVGRYVFGTVAGVTPGLMGIGPAAAIPQLLRKVGLETSDIGIWELNEAFASQSVHCVQTLGLDMEKVNPQGGAIALGHPLGATGARVVATLLNGLHAHDRELGVLSMCMSTGQGYAGLLVRE
ncbi:hypothetical protein TRICI_002470 [Trichomonascus ciferrii]|uniref:Thiolase N-terminal domain-containing protein n=1 Tax=Trichomonascus ciferrii TaxID=44093 RepID=A0A642VC06_9ASCO|nr:hypothetical protein TRICI_002470 [Trichomonascus ciferrii]